MGGLLIVEKLCWVVGVVVCCIGMFVIGKIIIIGVRFIVVEFEKCFVLFGVNDCFVGFKCDCYIVGYMWNLDDKCSVILGFVVDNVYCFVVNLMLFG